MSELHLLRPGKTILHPSARAHAVLTLSTGLCRIPGWEASDPTDNEGFEILYSSFGHPHAVSFYLKLWQRCGKKEQAFKDALIELCSQLESDTFIDMFIQVKRLVHGGMGMNLYHIVKWKPKPRVTARRSAYFRS